MNSGLVENGIVIDKGGDIIVGDSVLNSVVDEVGEEGNVVFKVGVDDLYDIG